MMLKREIVHLNNAPGSISKRPREALEATDAFGVVHPADNPEIVPNHFYFFGSLKGKLQTVAVTDQKNSISANTEIFSDTSQDEFIAVEQNLMTRLCWTIKNRG
jgi:hypothetical protein